MAANGDAPAFVYDFCVPPVDSEDRPPLGQRQWLKFGQRQMQRLEEKDHMVIYVNFRGSCKPFRFVVEEADDRWRYRCRGEVDLLIQRTPKATIVTSP